MSGAAQPDTAPALEVIGLRKSFAGRPVVDDVSLAVAPGEVLGIIGPSGCGKTTLLRAIAHLDPPDDGFVRVSGHAFGPEVSPAGVVRRRWRRGRDISRERHRIGFVFQQLHLWPHLDVLGNVTRAQSVVLGRPGPVAAERARALLARLGIADRAAMRPTELSGGQQQRVAIARALALDPPVLLFDEPTSALDPELAGEVAALLRTIAGEGRALVVVSHSLGFVRRLCDRLAFLDGGHVVEEGPAARLLDAPRDARLVRFLAALAPPFPSPQPAR
ncbi:amino acid ABC transporter ATP-binding protein [Ancylobacter mangrovi]|uniref:amino acid ABC transporter ATP-binding protein n=1 Tax=Ancylobacter mangrovi TaxID=2972472 RepID=UPI002161FEE1|nr:ATP-binding cassette domain-containing protein [Ancylobacter mangrovi]MCS0505110.1 ATP-binding cassette domain-containing protein [Ancylobacter mangrovi]